jgi:3-oxoacyl-[acyl-carrier-protein] synthase III
MVGAGIIAVSSAFPDHVRDNDYYRTRYPAVVGKVEASTLGRLWSAPKDGESKFDRAMRPYLDDPFRGAVERRVLGPGERASTLQRRAALDALDAARMAPGDVDLLISCAFFNDQPGIGNAAFLARELGLRGMAWNLESACTGAVVALDTAAALVATGRHRSVLVTIACTYSSVSDESDTLSWFLGDGGGAFVVAPVGPGRGVLATYARHTGETCGAFFIDLVIDDDGAPRERMKAGTNTGSILRETAEPLVKECCEGALAKAGVDRRDVALFLFNTPTAWYAKFCADALGVDPAKTVDCYPKYANIGPALVPVNLHTAAREGRVKDGDLVLVYAVGSASSAAATVMRWGDVKAGPPT